MKKRFVLASLTTVSGIVAMASMSGACSSTPIGPSLEDASGSVGPPDARSDARSDATKDGSQEDAGPAGIIPCPAQDEIDSTTFPWKPPTKTPGACSEADLAAFVSHVEKTDDPQKWKGGITNAACRDCVFAKETTTWPPLIENASGQLAALNVGGCIAIASGKESCGKAYQQWHDCYLEVCTECPGGDVDSFSKCVTAANKKACKKAFDAIVGPAGCGDTETAANAETACDGETYVFEGPIRAQCIGLGDGDL